MNLISEETYIAKQDALAEAVRGLAVSSVQSVYHGKTLSVLGASYELTGYGGVTETEDLWWARLCRALGMTLLTNNSVGGSTVTGANGAVNSRCVSLDRNGVTPDVILVTLGGNDFRAGIAMGDYDGTGAFPTVNTLFSDAYAMMLDKICAKYATSEIWVCTRPPLYRAENSVGFPTANAAGGLLKDYNDKIRCLADVFGVGVIDFDKCGITCQNRSLYSGDYNAGTGYSLHPNTLGHALLADCAIRALDPACQIRYASSASAVSGESYAPTGPAVTFEQGTIMNGVEQTGAARLRSAGYLASAITAVTVPAGYLLLLIGYSAAGTYAGYDTGDTVIGTGVNNWSATCDLAAFREAYPGYSFRLLVKKADGSEFSSVSATVTYEGD